MMRHQLTTSLGVCRLYVEFVAIGLDNDCLDEGTDAGSRCVHDAAAEELNGSWQWGMEDREAINGTADRLKNI